VKEERRAEEMKKIPARKPSITSTSWKQTQPLLQALFVLYGSNVSIIEAVQPHLSRHRQLLTESSSFCLTKKKAHSSSSLSYKINLYASKSDVFKRWSIQGV
jgi:hypothetical protein